MRKDGAKAEDIACRFLKEAGFEILDRNFYSRFGEIDIVAYKDNTIHFIEVKSSKKYDPIYYITPKKMQKILKTIDYYMFKNSINIFFQIDAIIIKNNDVEYINNITL